jgi:hypothetical protein
VIIVKSASATRPPQAARDRQDNQRKDKDGKRPLGGPLEHAEDFDGNVVCHKASVRFALRPSNITTLGGAATHRSWPELNGGFALSIVGNTWAPAQSGNCACHSTKL